MMNDLTYKFVKPGPSLSEFVDGFWMLHNQGSDNKDVVLLPDGRIDLFISQSATEPFHMTLLGLTTHPEQATIVANTHTFAISFNLLAAEYIFHNTVANLLDSGKNLSKTFWNFDVHDLHNFNHFCKKASEKIQSLLPKEMDSRKTELFNLIYTSNGALSVKEISEKVFWSSRQINRYFNQQFGLSLKAYCDILRFRASFSHIKEGKLFPDQNFVDQSHFIKAVKKLSGALPKELSKNQNDRFIQFSTLPDK